MASSSDNLLAQHREQMRRERLTRAMQELESLNAKLSGPRPPRRSRTDVQERVDAILRRRRVRRYLKVQIVQEASHYFRQAARGRPGPNTRYIRKTRKFWSLKWSTDDDAIGYDRKSDGMYPLLTNDRGLTNAQVLDAHKRQPMIEKRFEQTKSVFEIAPVFLKNEGRIEALFFVYFLSLLVQALIERELRQAMKREDIDELPLYPEERCTRRPTAEQIFRLFTLTQRHILQRRGRDVHVFSPELTDLQRTVLRLLGVPEVAYR